MMDAILYLSSWAASGKGWKRTWRVTQEGDDGMVTLELETRPADGIGSPLAVAWAISRQELGQAVFSVALAVAQKCALQLEEAERIIDQAEKSVSHTEQE